MHLRLEPSPEPSFRLVKHYVDGVDTQGNACIAYAGEVAWGRFCVPLCGLSFFPSSGGESTRWRPVAAAVRNAGGGLEMAGSGWTIEIGSHQAGFGAPLWRSEHGSVDWRCLVPAGEIRMRGRGSALTGRGYAERIDITIEPWNLPLDVLLWGRFVNETESLAWIEWRGPQPLRRVWWNGRDCEPASLSFTGIETKDGPRLEIAARRVLREGPVAGLLSGIRPIASLLPSLARMRETKLLGEGMLVLDGGIRHRGWVIHEEVIFR